MVRETERANRRRGRGSGARDAVPVAQVVADRFRLCGEIWQPRKPRDIDLSLGLDAGVHEYGEGDEADDGDDR